MPENGNSWIVARARGWWSGCPVGRVNVELLIDEWDEEDAPFPVPWTERGDITGCTSVCRSTFVWVLWLHVRQGEPRGGRRRMESGICVRRNRLLSPSIRSWNPPRPFFPLHRPFSSTFSPPIPKLPSFSLTSCFFHSSPFRTFGISPLTPLPHPPFPTCGFLSSSLLSHSSFLRSESRATRSPCFRLFICPDIYRSSA